MYYIAYWKQNEILIYSSNKVIRKKSANHIRKSNMIRAYEKHNYTW
jgi:hypothetical protein